MKSNLLLKLLMMFFLTVLYSSSGLVNAQSSNYPHFMKYFWSKSVDAESRTKIANQLINNTSLGKDYVKQLDNLFRELESLLNEKKSLEKENADYSNRKEQYEKQYNSAKTMLALVETNYSMCRSNCESIAQNANNIINNMNNLYSKMEDANNGLTRTYSRHKNITKRMGEMDKQQQRIQAELNSYMQENISKGNISLD